MAKIMLEEQEEFPTLPADSILLVKVAEAEVREMTGGRSGSWEKLNFKFKVLQILNTGDGSPAEKFDSMIGGDIYGGVPLRLTDHPENKLRIWVEAILGMSLGVGFELDTDYLLNREVRAITNSYDKRALDPSGKPYKGHGVETLLAKGSASAPQAQQAQPQASGWGAGASAQAPMTGGTQTWGQQAAPSQQPAQNPWGQPSPQQQPAMTGWGGSGNDDPPF